MEVDDVDEVDFLADKEAEGDANDKEEKQDEYYYRSESCNRGEKLSFVVLLALVGAHLNAASWSFRH